MTDTDTTIDPALNPSVIIVDDDMSLRNLLADYLSRFGFAVMGASAVRDLEALLAYVRPGVIILDIMMPEESGLDFFRRYSRAARDPIAVLFLTAVENLAQRRTGLGLGAEEYLIKPFEPPELVRKLRDILRRRGRTDPLAKTVQLFAEDPLWKSAVFYFGGFRFFCRSGRLETLKGERVPLSVAEEWLLSALLRADGESLSAAVLEETLQSPAGTLYESLAQKIGRQCLIYGADGSLSLRYEDKEVL